MRFILAKVCGGLNLKINQINLVNSIPNNSFFLVHKLTNLMSRILVDCLYLHAVLPSVQMPYYNTCEVYLSITGKADIPHHKAARTLP